MHMRITSALVVSVLVLQGCGGRVLGNDPNVGSSSKQHCTRAANQYVTDNYVGLDPLWREQERYRQYRICMAKVNASPVSKEQSAD